VKRIAAPFQAPTVTSARSFSGASNGGSGKTNKTTHFGFQTVSEGLKKGMVGEVFTGVASNYDVMNDVMSLGVHRLWKDYFIGSVQPVSSNKILDVAGGTGDIAFRAIDYVRKNEKGDDLEMEVVTVCDINASMLEEGKKKVSDGGYFTSTGMDQVRFIEGDAEHLPFEDASFDIYTIAFGLRNVTDIPKALSEAQRVLKPGGRFFCLEFSRVENPVLGPLYDLYSFNVIPPMGELVAQNRDAYQYLVESIRKHPPQQELKRLMIQSGFSSVQYENLSMGVVAIHSGYKSADSK